MAWWPGNERDNIFATTKRHGRVQEQTRSNLNLEQGLIGAATLLEKNKRLDWAFATTESHHSIGDIESLIHSFMLIILGHHSHLRESIDFRKTG